MRYKLIIDSVAAEPLFHSEKKALNYFHTIKNHFGKTYQIVPISDPTESKKQEAALAKLTIYDKRSMDLYHAIENTTSDIELLRIAKLLQAELRARRKQKKIINPNNNAGSVKNYKNRTDVLEKCRPKKQYDEIVDMLLARVI